MMKQYNQHLSDMSKNALPVNVKQNVVSLFFLHCFVAIFVK